MASIPPPGRPRPARTLGLLKLTVAVHAAALAGIVLAPAAWKAVLGAIVANHVLVSSLGLSTRTHILGPVLSRLDPADGQAALTVDDGPDPSVTPAVLELLARHEAKASFFLIGERAEQHPELVRAIVDGGHRVENHTHRHPSSFAFSGPRRLEREIDPAQASLAELAGVAPGYFRPPAGIRNPFLEPVLARRGLLVAAWSRRGYDAVATDPRAISRRLLKNVGPGDVLLLHDGRGRHGSNPQVLAVLADVLPALADQGLRVVALPRPDLSSA